MELKEKLLKDIDDLIDNLDYLRKFVEIKMNDNNEFDFSSKINTVQVDIQLLNKKINYKK